MQEKAVIVGTDMYSDLAVLKTDAKAPAVAALGNSDLLNPGESVIAIGSPLGNFKNTVTVGVVSATGRSIDTGNGYQIEDLIQTDAAINHGNSGGPLMNLAGEVIGINTLVVRNTNSGDVAEGLGFAVPVNTARAVAEQIIQKGYFSRPYMGIRFQQVTPDIAATYNLPVQWAFTSPRSRREAPPAQQDCSKVTSSSRSAMWQLTKLTPTSIPCSPSSQAIKWHWRDAKRQGSQFDNYVWGIKPQLNG